MVDIGSKRTLRVFLLAPSYSTYRFGLPPYNIAYLANYIKRRPGIKLQVVNGDEYDLDALQRIIAYSHYDVFATGGMVTLFSYFRTVLNTSKQHSPDAWRVLGGPITSTDMPYLFKTMSMDVAVIGEGEQTFAELLSFYIKHKRERAIPKAEEYNQIDGIAFISKRGTITITKYRAPLDLLENDLLPAWEYFNVKKYTQWNPLKSFIDFPEKVPQRQFSILIGRGCPFSCTFCGSPFGKEARVRGLEEVLVEIKGLSDKYGINVLYIMSEVFFFQKKQILEFCYQLKRNQLGVRWICNLRVDMFDDEIAHAMKEAGCDHITFGIESGSDRILKLMNKGTNVQQNVAAMDMARKAGIYPGGAVMFGYLDETIEEMRQTVDLMLQHKHVPSSASIATAIPGTLLYTQVLECGIIKDKEEYLMKLDGRIDVCDEPKANLSQIPDKIFWPTVVAEYRRLMTGLFRNGLARITETQNGDVPRILLQCPFCTFTISDNSSALLFDLGTKFLCRNCRRIVWVDPFALPLWRNHGQALAAFARQITAEDATYAYVGYNSNSRWLLQLDLWGLNPSRLACVFDLGKDLLPRKEYNVSIFALSELQRLKPEYLFVTQHPPNSSIIRTLLRFGYTKKQIMPLCPPLSGIWPQPWLFFRPALADTCNWLLQILRR